MEVLISEFYGILYRFHLTITAAIFVTNPVEV